MHTLFCKIHVCKRACFSAPRARGLGAAHCGRIPCSHPHVAPLADHDTHDEELVRSQRVDVLRSLKGLSAHLILVLAASESFDAFLCPGVAVVISTWGAASWCPSINHDNTLVTIRTRYTLGWYHRLSLACSEPFITNFYVDIEPFRHSVLKPLLPYFVLLDRSEIR